MPQCLSSKDEVAQWESIWFVIWRSEVRPQPVLNSFSKTSPENSGGAENSAEISGTNGINFFCYMYESSLRHPVCVPKINVKACNSVLCSKKGLTILKNKTTKCVYNIRKFYQRKSINKDHLKISLNYYSLHFYRANFHVEAYHTMNSKLCSISQAHN